jgi:hypothetical protein
MNGRRISETRITQSGAIVLGVVGVHAGTDRPAASQRAHGTTPPQSRRAREEGLVVLRAMRLRALFKPYMDGGVPALSVCDHPDRVLASRATRNQLKIEI